MDTTLNQTPHIVIVGAGFGGLRAARRLAKTTARVTLLDRNNYHLFQPLLYQVATAGLSPDGIARPVRAILRGQQNLTFRMTEVTGIDLNARRLRTAGGDIAYDALVLAPGGETHTFGIESVARNAFGLKGLEDATGIRNHLLRLIEQAASEPDAARRQALLTFVVAGGGPTGVECAGAIAELLRTLHGEYPGLDFSQARILLLEAANQVLAHLPADLGEYTARALAEKGVTLRFGAAVQEFDGKVVRLRSGEEIPTETLIWAAGVRASKLLDGLGLEQDRLGRARVNAALQVPGHPEVYVIGDAAALDGADGKPLPMVAPVAMQQGDLVADNILRQMNGEPARDFVYHDPGMMATIGRNRAVALLGSLRLRGLLAWLAWVVVHIFQLIGFRNRLVVLADWIISYFSYDRSVRIIDPAQKR